MRINQKNKELQQEQDVLNYINKLIDICKNILEICKQYDSKPDINFIDDKDESEIFEKIKEMLLLSAEGDKEDFEYKFNQFLGLEEEKNRELFDLFGARKDANNETENAKKELNRLN